MENIYKAKTAKLKVATFDIDNNTANFPQRIYNLANILLKKKFDIICLQEDFNSDDFSSGKFLNLELDYNYISIKTRVKKRDSSLSSSNLTVLSKYEINLLDTIYFNKDKNEERAAMFLEVFFDDKKILLVNTQLCTLNNSRRIAQIREILNKTNCYNDFDVTMLCGNLNALSSYKEIRLIEDNGFIKKKTRNKR